MNGRGKWVWTSDNEARYVTRCRYDMNHWQDRRTWLQRISTNVASRPAPQSTECGDDGAHCTLGWLSCTRRHLDIERIDTHVHLRPTRDDMAASHSCHSGPLINRTKLGHDRMPYSLSFLSLQWLCQLKKVSEWVIM